MFYSYNLVLKDKNQSCSQRFEAHTIVENSSGDKVEAFRTAKREQEELGYYVCDIQSDGMAKTVKELLHY